MPVDIDSHENGSVLWWAADVAADNSGEITLLGGDIRPTGAGYFHVSVHERDTPITTKMLCAFASLRLCVEGIFRTGNMSADTESVENEVGTRIDADNR